MTSSSKDSIFASHARTTYGNVERQQAFIRNSPELVKLLDAVPSFYVILNENRQVVYANTAFQNFASEFDTEPVIGRRPGEIFHCTHLADGSEGCGSSKFCKTCGAANAILQSQNGGDAILECQISLSEEIEDGALDLRVWASPLIVNNESFTSFSIQDISDEKRRQVLERLFFHDISNSVAIVKGYADIIVEKSNDSDVNKKELLGLHNATNNLLREISGHRILTSAEDNQLKVDISDVELRPVLESIVEQFKIHPSCEGKSIKLSPIHSKLKLKTDESLLRRILMNMLMNAIEASVPEDLITINVEANEGSVNFSVHNPAFIPVDDQMRLFNRSFTTKGAGRGLGTYSMKLLGERFLGGKVKFTSRVFEGTTFSIELPT